MNRPNRPGLFCCEVLRAGVDAEPRAAERVVLRVRPAFVGRDGELFLLVGVPVEEYEVLPDVDRLRGCGLRESVEDIVLL